MKPSMDYMLSQDGEYVKVGGSVEYTGMYHLE
jgi:hypothetical protein